MTTSEARAILRRLFDERRACEKLHEVLEILEAAEGRLSQLTSACKLRQGELDTLTRNLDEMNHRVEVAVSAHQETVKALAEKTALMERESAEVELELIRTRDAYQALVEQLQSEWAAKDRALAEKYRQKEANLVAAVAELMEKYDVVSGQLRKLSQSIVIPPTRGV